MITVHPDEADQNCNHSCINCKACVQLSLDEDGIYGIIDTKTLKTPRILLLKLENLDNGGKPGIGTLNKKRGDILLECCTEIFKEIFLCYVNEILFIMVKTA